MDGNAVILSSNAQLQQLRLEAIGDILAIKNFSIQKSQENSGVVTSDFDRLVYEIKGSKGNRSKENPKGKSSRLVRIGFQIFCEKKKKYVNVRKCGGARSIKVSKNASVTDLIAEAKNFFFQNGKNFLGNEANFNFRLGNFSSQFIENTLVDDGKTIQFNVENYIRLNNLTHVRLYLLARKKNFKDLIVSDDDDSEDDIIISPTVKRSKLIPVRTYGTHLS